MPLQIMIDNIVRDMTPEEETEFLAVRAAAQVTTEADYARAIQAHIDATAQARGYNDGDSCIGHLVSTVPAWAAEAAAFNAWRDAVWLYAFAQLAAVEAQQRSQPSVAELVAELPTMTWPQA